jgi:hypothetical protein
MNALHHSTQLLNRDKLMKRIFLTGLSALLLGAAFATVAQAAPPSGDSNPSDLGNPTVDTSQIIHSKATEMAQQKAAPPSGDSNPSDLGNATVNTGQIINPNAK